MLTVMHQPLAGPTATRSVRRIDVGRDVSLTLGSCACEECAVDLVVPAWPGVWSRCVVTARDDHWRLDNLCLDIEAVVVDLENPRLRVSASPGRRRLVIPFEFSELSFHIGLRQVSETVTVIGPEVVVEDLNACRLSSAHLTEIDLRPGTTYLAVLEELHRGAASAGVPPSSVAVSQGLDQRGIRITPKSVDHHVDYVFQRLFPEADVSRMRGYKRWVLASLMQRWAARNTD